MSVVHSEFTIERHYDFTPAQIFGAFADPELKGRWFAVPAHFDNRAYELDFRVGGGELNRGTVPGGPTYTFTSRFYEITTNERIVFAYDMHADKNLMSVSLTTVQFLPVAGNTTRLMFTEQGAFFDGLDEPAAREHGTGESLTALGTCLTTELR
jgi:uncharacterized protein YndB with AHSA1/START domain